MAHRRGTSFRGRGISEAQRRKKSWFAFNTDPGADLFKISLTPPDLVAQGESVAVAFADGVGFSPSVIESTVLRIRGMVDIPKSTVASGGLSIVFAFGIGFVTNEAAAALAVPNPATATGADWDGWMFLRTSTQIALDITGTMLDVKAMRKWKSGTSLVLVAGLATDLSGGAGGMDFSIQARALLLLP